MYCIKVHSKIRQIISIFFAVGVWHCENRTDLRKKVFKILYLGLYVLWPIALFGGAFDLENELESMFSLLFAIPAAVIAMRLYYFITKKDEIITFIRKMGTHFIQDREEFNEMNNKINLFILFASFYILMIGSALATLVVIALPTFSNENRLPLAIYFPFDWKNNSISYWMGYSFVTFEYTVSTTFSLFNVIVWYMMMSCVIKYQILGKNFKRLGRASKASSALNTIKFSEAETQDLLLEELILLIKSHKNLQETTDQIKLCFSSLYFAQIGTSGIAICGSVYLIVFGSSANPFRYGCFIAMLLYQFFDIFMITYFGNEIKFWSSSMSYSLFECDWLDQSKSFKKCMLITIEVLKQPQVLVIGKLYPLDLEVFTKILNFSYSMFNLLKNTS